jgi:hypothetical protein
METGGHPSSVLRVTCPQGSLYEPLKAVPTDILPSIKASGGSTIMILTGYDLKKASLPWDGFLKFTKASVHQPHKSRCVE